MLDQQLSAKPPEGIPIYSRPVKVQVGQPLTGGDLEQRLEQLGYQADSEKTADWYRAEGKKVVFQHVGRVGLIETYQVTFSGNGRSSRIESITYAGENIPEAPLKPELLSNLSLGPLEKRIYIKYSDLPESLVRALLVAEDEHFFYHHGMDLLAMLRAAWANIRAGETLQGGSTLSQQFVKNYLLTPERTLTRKLEEAFLALLLELRFSKEEILEMYVNEIYMGNQGAYSVVGFGQAARTYLQKDVHDLTVAESALLAGMIRAPNRYTPEENVKSATARRNHVLDRMAEEGFITAEERAEAYQAPIPKVPVGLSANLSAPYFVDYVKGLLEQTEIERDKGCQIYTTLDAGLQEAAVQAVDKIMERIDRLVPDRKGRPQVALVALDPRSGEILAFVGGRDYGSSQYNRAVNAYRQPGSAFKPFVHATALSTRSFTLSSFLTDAPTTFEYENKEYSPANYHEQYFGRVTLRQALARSLNVPTVQLAQQVGFPAVSSFANDLSFSTKFEPFPSIALGTIEVTPLELAQAYTVFANGGKLQPIQAILAIENDGMVQVLEREAPDQVLSPGLAYLITSSLQTAIDSGTAAGARARGFSLPAAGKTGTSDDSWFVGYTPDLLCAVWVGLDDSTPLEVDGSRGALPLWAEFMLNAQRRGYLSGERFIIPDDVTTFTIDPTTGLRASSWCDRTQAEYYLKGSEPLEFCSRWNHLDEWLSLAQYEYDGWGREGQDEDEEDESDESDQEDP